MDAVFEVPGAPWVGASPALASVRRTTVAIVAAVLALLLVAGWLMLRDSVGWPFLLAALGVLAAAASAGWVAVARNASSWGWAEREVDLFVRHGIWVRRLEVVPYGRMQLVEVTAGPLQRRAGIATVTLRTAAPGSDARILGVPAAEASRLRDRLTARGEAQAAGL
jgi:membrane protein YdbS with pleckstrin-like domain